VGNLSQSQELKQSRSSLRWPDHPLRIIRNIHRGFHSFNHIEYTGVNRAYVYPEVISMYAEFVLEVQASLSR
jgi:hypothetical protein